MSMSEELKRIKNEKETEKKQKYEQAAKVLEKKQQAVSKFNPMVRRLLDEFGLAIWGGGLFGRKYKVGQISKDYMTPFDDRTIWCVYKLPVRYEPNDDITIYLYDVFFVELFFDIKGNPSHFFVPTTSFRLESLNFSSDCCEKVGISDSDLEMALLKCYKKVGHIEYRTYNSLERAVK